MYSQPRLMNLFFVIGIRPGGTSPAKTALKS